MAVGLSGLPMMLPVAGIRLGVATAGIKKPGRRDLVVIAADEGTNAAAVFTKNAFCAAPVTLAKHSLAHCAPRYLMINTGYANAGTGERGLADARACTHALAKLGNVPVDAVLPFSTGVIGEPLPVDRIIAGLPSALETLSATGWDEAAHGIMTTDTVPKGASKQIMLGGKTVTVTGIAKGSGMIAPNMATMLSFVATDARVDQHVLQQCLSEVADDTFNCVTVDGDTSTNDACLLLATGKAGNAGVTSLASAEGLLFKQAVYDVCLTLAHAIVRDGEGATKFMTVSVEGGRDRVECRRVAQTVANSPLVKTAFFASDPNWGRIVAAVGRAGVDDLDISKMRVYLGDVCIVSNGGRDPGYTESAGVAVMAQPEIAIRIDLARGVAQQTVWTCDFSYDYVKINAEYRS